VSSGFASNLDKAETLLETKAMVRDEAKSSESNTNKVTGQRAGKEGERDTEEEEV